MIVNETLKIIKQRRSIRAYRDEQIKDEELQAILEAGMYAPNAGGQAWHFTAVQNQELLGRLNQAAKEAALYGTIGIAVSVEGSSIKFCEDAARFVTKLCETVFKRGLPFGTFLNVNLPNLPLKAIAGVQISRQGVQILTEYVDKRTDPRNKTYYWQGRDIQSFGEDSRIDGAALNQNFISITPVKCDMTDYRALEELAEWDLGI